MERHGTESEIRLKGLPLSGGCAVARVCMFSEQRHSKLPRYRVSGSGADAEGERLRAALRVVVDRLAGIQKRISETLGKAEAEIFVAQRMMVEDEALMEEVVACIVRQGLNAETAVAHTLDRYESQLAAIDNEYLSERASDFGEVKRRILDVLAEMKPSLECENEDHCQRGRNRVVVAEELTPSLTVDLDAEHLMGFVTEHGGINSHAAILARALGIPAVSGLPGVRSRVSCGMEILVDGDSGEVVIWPTEHTVAEAHARRAGRMRLPDPIAPVRGFEVLANVGTPLDVRQALDMEAEGIGLYRTELEVIAAPALLNEESLTERYSDVVRSMGGRKIIFRLFDIGSDKPLPSIAAPKEDNPALGRRGARFLLARMDLLGIQARALARASRVGPIHIMYPMIAGREQFKALKNAFREQTKDLDTSGIRHGAMLEVPSACFEASDLLQEADFASIGTNDLTQYFFAVDRNNELVAADYNPDQPVFWRLLASLVHAAKVHGKPLCVCGELAADPRFAARLIEMGIVSVSVSPRSISNVRQAAERHPEKAAVG